MAVLKLTDQVGAAARRGGAARGAPAAVYSRRRGGVCAAARTPRARGCGALPRAVPALGRRSCAPRWGRAGGAGAAGQLGCVRAGCCPRTRAGQGDGRLEGLLGLLRCGAAGAPSGCRPGRTLDAGGGGIAAWDPSPSPAAVVRSAVSIRLTCRPDFLFGSPEAVCAARGGAPWRRPLGGCVGPRRVSPRRRSPARGSLREAGYPPARVQPLCRPPGRGTAQGSSGALVWRGGVTCPSG